MFPIIEIVIIDHEMVIERQLCLGDCFDFFSKTKGLWTRLQKFLNNNNDKCCLFLNNETNEKMNKTL
jgi:hypothetical protein